MGWFSTLCDKLFCPMPSIVVYLLPMGGCSEGLPVRDLISYRGRARETTARASSYRVTFVRPARVLVVAIFMSGCGPVSRSFCSSILGSLRFRQLTYPYKRSTYLAVRNCCAHGIGSSSNSALLHVYHLCYSYYRRARTILLSSVIPCSRISLPYRVRVLATRRGKCAASTLVRRGPSVSRDGYHCVVHVCLLC